MKDLALMTLRCIGTASLLRFKKRGRLTVLSLHRISEERNSFWNPIAPETFDRLLVYVKRHYRVIGFNDLSDPGIQKSDRPLLILSFDDGYFDFYQNALPLLKKHSLKCNHNIVNECASSGMVIWTQRLNTIFEHCQQNAVALDFNMHSDSFSLLQHNGNWTMFYLDVFRKLLTAEPIERNNLLQETEQRLGLKTKVQMMGWDEIRECAANGIEIGSHTYSHDVLSTIEDGSVLKNELIRSKAEIEKEIEQAVSVLALPNGQTGELADTIIRESDFKYVLYVDDMVNCLPLAENADGPLKISRINLVDEPFSQMALRTERFHSLIRRYV